MKIAFFFSIFLLINAKKLKINRELSSKKVFEAAEKDEEKSIEEKYIKLPSISMKAFIPNKNIVLLDIRNNTISNSGYIQNSLLLPLTMGYETWFPVLIEEFSNLVLICDETNYIKALERTEDLGPIHLLGYVIYDEIVNEREFDIQIAEYNVNTKKSVEKLVENGEYLLDIREVSEYKETGVIKDSNLIPLSTFKTDYTKIPKDVDIYVFCKGGGRALLAMSFLKRLGYTNKIIIMKGGMSQTIKEGYPLVSY